MHEYICSFVYKRLRAFCSALAVLVGLRAISYAWPSPHVRAAATPILPHACMCTAFALIVPKLQFKGKRVPSSPLEFLLIRLSLLPAVLAMTCIIPVHALSKHLTHAYHVDLTSFAAFCMGYLPHGVSCMHVCCRPRLSGMSATSGCDESGMRSQPINCKKEATPG